jgi:hypothetical protein
LNDNTGVYALGLALVVSCHAHNNSFTLRLQGSGTPGCAAPQTFQVDRHPCNDNARQEEQMAV